MNLLAHWHLLSSCITLQCFPPSPFHSPLSSWPINPIILKNRKISVYHYVKNRKISVHHYVSSTVLARGGPQKKVHHMNVPSTLTNSINTNRKGPVLLSLLSLMFRSQTVDDILPKFQDKKSIKFTTMIKQLNTLRFSKKQIYARQSWQW